MNRVYPPPLPRRLGCAKTLPLLSVPNLYMIMTMKKKIIKIIQTFLSFLFLFEKKRSFFYFRFYFVFRVHC